MSTSPKTNHRSLVSLRLPRPVPALLVHVRGIVTRMTGNPAFPSAGPNLALVTAAADALAAAQTAAQMRTIGAVATRDEKRVALLAVLEQLKACIQAAADADVENGASIIASAGVAVRKPRGQVARVFAIRPGRVSGSVVIVAPTAARRASYEWEFSTDGGKTWVELAPSLQAKTELSGLVPASTVIARYRSITKTGPSDWSPPASFLVR
jgi:hypothetical protein